MHGQGGGCYFTARSPWPSVDLVRNLERAANPGKDAAEIRKGSHSRPGQIVRNLSRELSPGGRPGGTKSSESEVVAGTPGDEMARQLIAMNVREQADDWPEGEPGERPLRGGPARKAPDLPRGLTTTRGGVAGRNASRIAPAVGGLFPPQNQAAGVDHSGFSPRVRPKVVPAGVHTVPYQPASRDRAELSEERIDRRDAAVASRQRLPLMAKGEVANPKRSCPRVAMVSVDGGRPHNRPGPAGPNQDSRWRESKVSVLGTDQSDLQEADPDPHVPGCSLDLKRTKEVMRGPGHALPVGSEFGGENKTPKQDEATGKGRDREPRPCRPERPVRGVPASRKRAEGFGPTMHQAAWGRDPQGAGRRAFSGDGLPVNWTIRRRHFASTRRNGSADNQFWFPQVLEIQKLVACT